jgi:hypothetical protein
MWTIVAKRLLNSWSTSMLMTEPLAYSQWLISSPTGWTQPSQRKNHLPVFAAPSVIPLLGAFGPRPQHRPVQWGDEEGGAHPTN